MELDQQLTEPCTLWCSPHAQDEKACGDQTPRLDPAARQIMFHDLNLGRSAEPQPLRGPVDFREFLHLVSGKSRTERPKNPENL